MTPTFTEYPEYKDSGVPWLGNIPEHWGIRSLGSLTKVRSQRGRPDLPLLSVVREKGVIPRSSMAQDENHNYIPDDLSNYKVVKAGDLVINKMKAWQGSLGIAPIDGIVSPAYFVLEFGIDDRGFGQTLLRSRPYVSLFAQASDGVRIGQWDLSPSAMKRMPILVPPPGEQQDIARFLNYIDRRIRRYILAKQNLIRVLEEQRQAEIQRVITRGLMPAVQLKSAGVEWLTDMPAHWSSMRLKFVASKIVDCLHATPFYSDEGAYPAIRTADVTPGALLLSQARLVDEAQYLTWTGRMAPSVGDILYTREGERFGIAAPVPEGVRLCISQRMMAFRIREAFNSAYMMWQLNCQHVYAQAASDLIGSAAPHVNVERIKNFWLLVPPREEQDEIAAQLAVTVPIIDEAIQHSRHQIALLREYRSRVVADVVTGKVDVREVAAGLVDALEQLDDLPPTDEALASVDDDELLPDELAEEEVA